MFRIPESKKDNFVDRQNDDLLYIERFIKEGLIIQAQPIQSFYRMGRYEEGKARPLKITFCQKASQIKVIENLSALQNANEDFKISVCIDRTMEERTAIKELIQEAKEKTEKSQDKKYVVRGNFRPFIHESNKIA